MGLKEQGFIEVWPSKCVWRWIKNKGVFQRAQINASSGWLWIGGIQILWKPLKCAAYLEKTHKDLEWRLGCTKRRSWKTLQGWSIVMWDICCQRTRASQQITTKVFGESTLAGWKENRFCPVKISKTFQANLNLLIWMFHYFSISDILYRYILNP